LEFQSANATIVKSIKQRNLLNTWLRLYARDQRMPRIEEYQPERLADELQELVYYTVEAAQQPPRLIIESDGMRMSSAHGHTGKGRYFDDFLASLKTISEDGGFKIRNLMRGNDVLPTSKLRSLIDRDLFHRVPGRIPAGDLIEFG
jgi:hypothetical protein